MVKVVSKHVKHYSNDFYLHDTFSYLEGDKVGIWLLRDSGTHFIQMGDSFREDFMEVYKTNVTLEKVHSLLDGKVRLAA